MPGHVGVTAVHLRIKVIGLDHRHLGIIRHQQLRDTAEEGEGGIVARDPVGELLVESLASRLSLNISRTWLITLLVGIQSSWLLSQGTAPTIRLHVIPNCAPSIRNGACDDPGIRSGLLAAPVSAIVGIGQSLGAS